jgi:hypothetical protein
MEAARRWGRPTPATPAEPEPLPPAADATPAPKVDATGRLHAKDGKFASKSDSAPAPDGGAPEPQAATTPPAPEAEAPAAPAAPQTIRIPIPEGDFRRATGGLEYIDVEPGSKMEQFVRFSLNNEVRRRTVEEQKRTIHELRERLARTEAVDEATREYRSTPQYADAVKQFQWLQEQEEAGEAPKGTAERFWQGVDADFQRYRDQKEGLKLQQVNEQAEAEANKAKAETWTEEARQRTSKIPQEVRALPEFGALFDGAVRSFAANTQNGLYDTQLGIARSNAEAQGLDPDEAEFAEAHKLFEKHFKSVLLVHPSVRATFDRLQSSRRAVEARQQIDQAELQRRIEAAKRQAVEEERRRIAAQREAAPPNPLAGLNSTARPALADQPPEDKPDRNLAGPALDRYGREQALQLARRYTAGW